MARETTLAVRFTTKDAETVRTALKNMGNEGERALKGIDRAAKAAKPSTKALVAVADDLRTGMEGVAGDIPGVSAGLRAIGPAGVVAAGALGVAAAGAMALARGAIEAGKRAADLVDETQKIGIGVEAFQELKFAADESGVAVENVGPALDNLNSSIGAIKSGLNDVKRIEAFKAIGISADQVRGFKSLEDALPVIADGLANVQDHAERVRIAEALGIRELLPLMEQGSRGLEAMSARARELGVVLDEQLVRAADAANRQIEIATLQMQTAFERLKLASAGSVAGIITTLARLIDKIGDASAAMGNFLRQAQLAAGVSVSWTPGVGVRTTPLRGANGRNRQRRAPQGSADRAVTDAFDQRRPQEVANVSPVSIAREAGGAVRAARAGGGDGGAAARAAAEAEQRARDEARKAERNQREMNRVSLERLEQAVASYEFEATESQVRVGAARRARELAVRERAVAEERNRQAIAQLMADKDLTVTTRDALMASQEAAHALELRAINAREAAAQAEWDQEKEEKLREYREASADMMREAEDTNLQATRDMAQTRQESLDVEMAILETAYRRQRAEIETAEVSEEAKALALAALARARQASEQNIRDAHQTGMQRYRDELTRQGRNIDDELNDIAADGLRATEDALADLITGTKDWGDAFSDVARGIIADLARIAARQWVMLPLMQAMGLGGGGGMGGGGGFNIGSILGSILTPGGGFGGGGLGKRAGGGAVNAGGAYLIGERGPELFFPGIGGSVMPNHALAGMGGGAGGLQVHIHNAPPGTTATQRPDGGLDVVVGRLDALENRVSTREQRFPSDVGTIVLDGMRRGFW
jgi:phage-related minor tail protein